MNGFRLKVSRELLGLTQQEAAEYIGKVSQRSWAHWEASEDDVKADVAAQIELLLAKRQEIIRQFAGSSEAQNAKKVVVIYYATPEHCKSVLDWRFSQSLARTLALDFGATLVEFNYPDYQQFLAGFSLEDTPAHRSEWAVYKATKK